MLGPLLAVVLFSASTVADERSACESGPPNDPAKVVAACTDLLNNRQPRDDRYVDLVKRGTALYQLGRLVDSVRDLDQAVRIDPTRYRAYQARGLDWLAAGYYGKCIADENRALNVYGEATVSRFTALSIRARCHAQNDDDASAAADFRQAMGLEPNDTDVMAQLALATAELGDRAGGEALIDTAIKLNPLVFGSYEIGSDLAYQAGDADGALRYLDQARHAGAIPPDGLWEYRQYRARALRLQGKTQEANDELAAALQAAGPYAQNVNAEIVKTRIAAGQLGSALSLVNTLLAGNATDGVLLTERARIYLLQQKYDLATADLDATLAKSPGSMLARCYRGEAWLGRRDLAHAKADFDAVLARKPDHIAALTGRARIAELRDDTKAAAAGYAEALGKVASRDFEAMRAFREEARGRLAWLSAVAMAAASPPSELRTGRSVASAPPASDTVFDRISGVPNAPRSLDRAFDLTTADVVMRHCARCHETDRQADLMKLQRVLSNVLKAGGDAAPESASTSALRPAPTSHPDLSLLYAMVLGHEAPYDVTFTGSVDGPVPTDAEMAVLQAWITGLKPKDGVARITPAVAQ